MACRIEPLSPDELDRLGALSSYSAFSHWRKYIYGEVRETTSFFVYELWSPSNSDQEERYAFFDEVEAWLEEHTRHHRVFVLNFSVRLIAITDRDEAFLFAMRFR